MSYFDFKKMTMMKKIWYDRKTGEFNWALLAVIALAGIFFYNILTANIRKPIQQGTDKKEDYFQQSTSGHSAMID